ncbi:MAG: hypothetical protein R5N71_01585 [Cutibacterium granulosum]|uniref:hypothetical protein n=1 Tax=Cutibacterium granulosum TaxID=33011 RepID=UPI002B2254A1|nr:hypothetical protein [Cutibacterium granulosum]MEA5648164.1 hypothetical protein [Cutibacterium granulosum]MEA5653423.1 hypothetical protein [Cutibacterium granulosum]MEA5662591.1 hypothetical protein [Cutibacterium granulosum]
MGFNNQFSVPYLTPRGNLIDLPVPDLPDSEELRALLRDLASRPKWACAYLDDVYAEYRELDNRRRSDISVDQPGRNNDEESGGLGADYFASDDPDFTEQVEASLAVVELLSPLTATQREYIGLHVLRGDRFTEIAADKTAAGQSTSADAVRKAASRGLAQLRRTVTES